MEQSLFTLLRRVDTPTVCNSIEVAQGKRGFRGYTRGTVLCSAPEEPALVGYACTAKIAAITPPQEPPEAVRAMRMAYYRYMANAPTPSMVVIEDMDVPHAVGAFWGEINTTIHKGFGLCGTLTNGVMRDLGDCPKGYPVIAGSIGPSHGFVHVKDIDCQVKVFGLSVQPRDLVHADRHGAVVIPHDIIPHLEAAIIKLLETEKLILEPARQDGFDFDAFEQAWLRFEAART